MEEKRIEKLKLISFLILILFIGYMLKSCKTIKTTDTTITKDSIREFVQLNIVKQGFNTMRFENPCDEFGNLRHIFYNSSSNGLETTIKDEDGSILINQKQNADTIYKEKTVYKDKLVYKDKIIEIPVKNKLNLWLLLYSIIATLWIVRNPLVKLLKKLILPL